MEVWPQPPAGIVESLPDGAVRKAEELAEISDGPVSEIAELQETTVFVARHGERQPNARDELRTLCRIGDAGGWVAFVDRFCRASSTSVTVGVLPNRESDPCGKGRWFSKSMQGCQDLDQRVLHDVIHVVRIDEAPCTRSRVRARTLYQLGLSVRITLACCDHEVVHVTHFVHQLPRPI